MATIQIPVLFDMSGDTIVFGEEASGDFVTSHLDFVLDMTTEANGISLNAADISSAILVGDQETGDSIFYSGGSSGNIAVDNLCNRIAKAITRGKLVHLPKTGNTSNSGIPMGGRANLYDLNGVYTENGNNDKYAIKYFSSIAPIGDEQMLGQAMARIASIHLVGSPLSAGIFQDKNSVQTQLETASTQTFNSGNTAFYNALAVQLSKVLGGSKSSAPMNNGSPISQEPIVGTLVKDLFVHAGSDMAAASKIWKTIVMLENDGTNIISLSRSHTADVLKIHKDTGAVTNLGENDGPDSYVIGNNFVYHDNHIYYIFEGKLGTPSNGSMYHVQKMNVNTGTITYDVVDLTDGVTENTGVGYSLSKDTSGNLWAFGKSIFKIPFATMTKQTMRSVASGSAGGVYNKDVVYHAGKDLFYIASSSLGSILRTYDPNTPGTEPVTVAGNGQMPVGDETDNGAGMSAKINMEQIALGSNGEYLYITSRDSNDKRIRVVKLSDYTISTHLTIEDYRGGITRIGNKLYYALSKSGDNLFKLKSVPEINASGTVTYQLDADGTSVPALKSIFEQLMNVPGRSQIMETRDISGVVENSNTTLAGGFPFISGDKLVVYLRPKINFAAQTFPEQHSTEIVGFSDKVIFNVPVYNIADSTGSITSQTYSQSSTQDNTLFIFEQAMDGTGATGTEYWTSAGGTYSAGNYIGSNVTKNIGLSKNVTVTSARLQNNNQIKDNSDNFIYNGGFVNYLNIQVGDTVTYQHPTLGSQTTTVASISSGGGGGVPYLLILTDNHNVSDVTPIPSCTFPNKKEGVAGEWGQVNIGASTYVKELSLTANDPYVDRMPQEFMLLGSNDGTNWTKMIHKTDEVTPWVASTPRTFSSDVAKAFTYYRYVVVNGPTTDNRTSLGHFNLKGSLDTEAFIQVGGKAGDPGFQPIASAVENIPGLITNFTATAQNIQDAFPGNATSGPESESLKWGWMGSANSDTLSLDTTDINDTGTIDLHIWKITITL